MAKFCENCGKELNENADFCLNCEKRVKEPNNQNMITKTILFIVGVIALIFVIAIVVAIVTPLLTNQNHQTHKKYCCQQNGGTFKNGTCQSTGVVGVDYDVKGYYDCIGN